MLHTGTTVCNIVQERVQSLQTATENLNTELIFLYISVWSTGEEQIDCPFPHSGTVGSDLFSELINCLKLN